jgi:hypothetical protein
MKTAKTEFKSILNESTECKCCHRPFVTNRYHTRDVVNEIHYILGIPPDGKVALSEEPYWELRNKEHYVRLLIEIHKLKNGIKFKHNKKVW